ncbi:hypothetical protein SAMN05421504_112100 [Amycolatopsis xylanica]|uniref:Uncharacterized protein n=1 Tax=Amycolatopsis xylanica TaxID=589385 RepID=A0A1H3RYE0_9PSEU|nr:hypothetical protein [Amycolatopsis xylanica]SDZ30756.1 hypothetical protein SAMN05421504_112100 [Amycolatopsis xylanica]
MCVSSDVAEFSGTTLYGGRCEHPEHGRIEVLGYQNTAENLAGGPNAMLLHVSTSGMRPDQFIPVGRHDDILARMAAATRPVAAAGGMAWMGADDEVTVFEHDIYTVVLAEDPLRVPAALSRVAPHKRPVLKPELLEFYADVFPGRSIALCCFDNADAHRAKPLLMWYRPSEPDRIVLPALDCHTGGVPDLRTPVATDHYLVFGTDDAEDWGEEVRYEDGMRHKLRAFLPDRVVGVQAEETLPNGDFAIDYDDLLRADLGRITRLQPA